MKYTIQTTPTFDDWYRRLNDKNVTARIRARLARVEDGNFGDCVAVGSGVVELRIHYGQGYRVYLKRSGSEIVVLLAGGDKSTQSQDIRTAIQLARHI